MCVTLSHIQNLKKNFSMELTIIENKRVLGVEKAGQHAGRTDGRLPEKDCPACAGQVNGCAGRM